MVTPDKGIFDTLTLNNEGRRVGQTWDPAKDEAAGEQCRAYGAANIMRLPTRLNITWENDTTLRINTDAGTQTQTLPLRHTSACRHATELAGLLRCGMGDGAGARGGARGSGAAAPARSGNLKVVTTQLRPGYVRKNGAPYSDRAVVTEYYDAYTLANGDQWFTVTTKVDDPVYFSRPLLTTSEFKKLPDATGWNPTPCSAR